MRDFFVLTHDSSRDDLEVVTDYDMDSFDLRTFWSGKYFEGDIPAGVRVWMSEGEASDYVGNPLSWEIVSERFWGIIRPLVAEHCQLIRVPLYYEKSTTPVRGYTLMNVTCCLAAATKHNKTGISI